MNWQTGKDGMSRNCIIIAIAAAALIIAAAVIVFAARGHGQ